jgi:hypothetical protein
MGQLRPVIHKNKLLKISNKFNIYAIYNILNKSNLCYISVIFNKYAISNMLYIRIIISNMFYISNFYDIDHQLHDGPEFTLCLRISQQYSGILPESSYQ